MGPGQVGADGGSVVRHVEEVGEVEVGSVHLLCMGGGLVLRSHLRLGAAEVMTAVLIALSVSGVPGASVQQLAMR